MRAQLEITMPLAFALAFGAVAAVEAAGYFFKLNKHVIAGARTLIIMIGLWFAVKASRETVTPKRDTISIGDQVGISFVSHA
jgi:hypothetical protein